MSTDFLSKQPVKHVDSSGDELGVTTEKPIVTSLSDGTELAAINASGEITTHDGDALAELQTISAAMSGGDLATETTLSAINDKLVDGTDIGDVTINNAAGASAVNIQDGGNSITVDGAVTVSATDLDIRDLTHVSDSVAIGDGTETVAVNVSNELQVRDDDANTSLGTLAGAVSGTEVQVDLVDIAGVATETTLSAINDKLVDGTDIGDVTINNAAGASAVNVQDGGNSLTVDATDLDIRALNLTDDAVKVSANASANAENNPIYVKVTDTVSASEIHDANEAVDVPKNGSDLISIVYVASGGTFLCKEVILSASGSYKAIIKAGTDGSETTKATVFGTSSVPTTIVPFNPPIEVADTDQLMVDVYNRDNKTQSIYGTIVGSQL